jgi:transglutaminase-like putative cysteine protease
MRMNRRELLIAGATLAGAAALPRVAAAGQGYIGQPSEWRQYETVTRIDLVNPQGRAQAWVPVPSVNEPDWFKTLGSEWQTNAVAAKIERDARYGAEMVHFEWTADETAPFAQVTSRVETRDRATNFAARGQQPLLSEADRKLYTAGTELIPTGGMVKETSDKIIAGASAKTDVEKAAALYQWIVDNTFRNAKTKGCGIGDIAAMLKTNDLGGKCADLNALYVGLARAAGLPARDVYGIRVAPSKFGYKSLGANSETITKAQHCRAEVYLEGFGWVPVDPADVRKVALEEPPANLAMGDAKVVAARNTLFGAWEGNWLAYNMAHDVELPGSKGTQVGFLMYPQALTAAGLADCLEPDRFKYVITSRQLT